MTTTTQKNQIEFDPTYGKLLDSETMGYTFYFEKDVDCDVLPADEFKALGRTTWVLFAAPQTPTEIDFDNGVAVEDWDLTQLDAEQLKELFEIQARMYDAIKGHFWYK